MKRLPPDGSFLGGLVLPAVMGTGVATERIQSGMILVVDGDAGTVTLVDEVESLA